MHFTCTNGQNFPFGFLGAGNLDSRLHTRSRFCFRATTIMRPSQHLTVPSGVPFVFDGNENQKNKKVEFSTKLFKNTIFTIYEWWRFQRYLICLKRLKIKISIRVDYTYRSNTKGSCKKKFISAKLQQYKNSGFESK